jgi:hypothetical protein
MPTSNYFTGPEVAAMLDSPAIISYPNAGGVLIEKSGVIGFGLTARDAVDDWGRKFAEMIRLPKDSAT